MGLEAVEFYLTVEKKYDIHLNYGCSSLGEFALTFLYAYQRKHPEARVLPEDVRRRFDEDLNEVTAVGILAEALGCAESSIRPETTLEELFPRKNRRETWRRFVRTARKYRWNLYFEPIRYPACYAFRTAALLIFVASFICAVIFEHDFFLYLVGGTLFALLAEEIFVRVRHLTRFPSRLRTVSDLMDIYRLAVLPVTSSDLRTLSTLARDLIEDLRRIYIEIYGYRPEKVDWESLLSG